MLVEVLIGVFSLLAALGVYLQWKFTYWQKRKLHNPQVKFPQGNMESPFARTHSLGFWLKTLYDKLKAEGHKHAGIYNFAGPVYFPIDPEYVKNVMQKDFHHFVERGIYYNEKVDPLSAHLFALGGEKWKNMRAKLTPTFTSGKMKMMFDTLVECSHPLVGAVEGLAKEQKAVDIKDMVGRYTTDVIGSCAFGLDCNSFKEADSEFRKYGKKVFQQSPLQFLKLLVLFSRPNIGYKLGLKFTPDEVTTFFMKVVKDTVNYRETNKVDRKDFMQLLINLKNEESGKAFTINEIAAQAFVFFLAGFETSSTTMTFCLFELASNQDIQEKVRQEINKVLEKHGKITYDAIGEMHYLTQVIDETLRKYPPVTQLTRKSVEDYQVPETDVVIEKGTNVMISILGLHRDPEYYPDPEKFDPERFSEENKSQIKHFTYIPFGEGPRLCIGMRFGMMQTRVGLVVLLKNFRFRLNNEMKIPLEIDSNSFVYSTKGPILLDAEKI